MQLKIHKSNNPGRFVIISVGGICAYVDYHMQPNAKQLKSHSKDTTNVSNKLEQLKQVSVNSFLVSIAVKSLYTNALSKEGLEPIKASLELKADPVLTSVILILLNLKVKFINFLFNSINFQQIKVCASGTDYAPMYTDNFILKRNMNTPKLKH